MRRKLAIAAGAVAALVLLLAGAQFAAPAHILGSIDERVDIPGVHDCWGIGSDKGGDGCPGYDQD